MSTDKVTHKKLLFALESQGRHWVGDGFYVHGLLRPTTDLIPLISPFILMDYASALEFEPAQKPRGVGVHPHRGFETVTFAYQGEVEHRDSAGGGGIIKAGDLQWMTAGRGVVHQEFHSPEFTAKGGVFEMVQLWVNLPKAHKMTAPRYQAIASANIPQIRLGTGLTLRVVAGSYGNAKGPAETFSPMNIFDLESAVDESVDIDLDEATNTLLLIRSGRVVCDKKVFGPAQVLVFDRSGGKLSLELSEGFKGLLLNAEPLSEPVVAHGPFVMNSRAEIIQAIEDYEAGKMGTFDDLKS